MRRRPAAQAHPAARRRARGRAGTAAPQADRGAQGPARPVRRRAPIPATKSKRKLRDPDPGWDTRRDAGAPPGGDEPPPPAATGPRTTGPSSHRRRSRPSRPRRADRRWAAFVVSAPDRTRATSDRPENPRRVGQRVRSALCTPPRTPKAPRRGAFERPISVAKSLQIRSFNPYGNLSRWDRLKLVACRERGQDLSDLAQRAREISHNRARYLVAAWR